MRHPLPDEVYKSNKDKQQPGLHAFDRGWPPVFGRVHQFPLPVSLSHALAKSTHSLSNAQAQAGHSHQRLRIVFGVLVSKHVDSSICCYFKLIYSVLVSDDVLYIQHA